jgi:hypothetical protein
VADAAPRAGWIRRGSGLLPRAAWVAIAVLAAAGSFWLGYRQGQRSAGYDAAAGADERGALLEQVSKLESANTELVAKVAELEMSRRLDREAYGQVERTLGDLQSRLARQGDDLAFYRSIVSPADGVQGLRIQRFAVRPGTGPREYVIEVTLIQAMRQDDTISGLAQVVVQGMESSRPAHYPLGELSGQPRAQLPFSFRYFQTIQRQVTLPADFQPFEVEIRAKSGRSGAPVVQSFPWKVSGSGGDAAAAPTDPPRGTVR